MKVRPRFRLFSEILSVAVVAAVVPACGGDGGAPPVVETSAPLCSELAAGDPRALFGQAVVPTDKVLESLIFGGMDPGTLEPINFELGFRLTEINVPVTAPADLHVASLEYTTFLTGSRAGETDYAISFHVCAVDDGEGKRVAVEGDFAHITALSPQLAEVVASRQFDCKTSTGAVENAEQCRLFFSPGAQDGLVITAGTLIGTAGGTGLTDYAPGFDFNLLDTRYSNSYENPDRLGSEEGPGKYFRYGACVYEYFVEPHRAAYMARVGQNGDLRVHDDAPCGTLSIGKAGSAAGVWIRADKASLDIDSDWVGVLENLLVLGPHPVFPGQREVVSSELRELASWEEGGLLIEFEQTSSGDVNRSFYDMTPGTIFCVSGAGFGIPEPHHYYLELGAGGDSLTIERLEASCAEVPQDTRAFSGAALSFVR